MERTTTTGFWRQRGATSSSSSRLSGPTPAVVEGIFPPVTLDATIAVSTPTGIVAPKGCYISGVDIRSDITGGAAQLVNVGHSVDDGAYVKFFNITTGDSTVVNLGSLDKGDDMGVGNTLTEDTEIYITPEAGGTAGTGTITVVVRYCMVDDGAIQN